MGLGELGMPRCKQGTSTGCFQQSAMQAPSNVSPPTPGFACLCLSGGESSHHSGTTPRLSSENRCHRASPAQTPHPINTRLGPELEIRSWA